MPSVDLLLKWKYILVFFYWKVYVHADLKYDKNHVAVYCIFKLSSHICNLNILYIALRVKFGNLIKGISN